MEVTLNTQAGFSLRGRNPDVLTCIANLSNDEVFTPPELANRMLDTLAEAWAAENNGADLWADSSVRFLDPCTKSGVFLREITSRLTQGLADKIPDLQTRVDHILSKQVFGVAITHLTSLLARRSVYCSKYATGKHSIAKSFDNDKGNIWFERLEHSWVNDRCKYCAASKATLDRGEERETHAYAFIHADNIKTRMAELFGDKMQFDVIIGNPPYQLSDGGASASAVPIYHLFVQMAKKLDPRFLTMVIPSRWMAGGRGLDDFRAEMLTDNRMSDLVDYPFAAEVFNRLEVKGGICYFLRDASHEGDARVTQIRSGVTVGPSLRRLDEFDVFIRDGQAVDILHKVLALASETITGLVSSWRPFAFNSDFNEFRLKSQPGDLRLHYVRPGKRLIGYVSRRQISKGIDLIDQWKLFAPEAYGAGETVPHQILGKPIIGLPGDVCTGTYLSIGPFASEAEVLSAQSYYQTRFFRFLISLRKITQHTSRSTYSWVPYESWDRTWTDKALYKKYELKQDQISYIESVIKPMDLGGEDE